MSVNAATASDFRLLTLDGGGAKGVYTLGFLREFEAVVGTPLSKYFHAIYGTSTGAIIAALLGLGYSVEKVLGLYRQHVPTILKRRLPRSRSKALATVADTLFEARTFEDFETSVGIVATNWPAERPLIFKSSVEAGHGMKATFKPGFGCSISKAVQASCSASPFFSKCVVDLANAAPVESRDGGFAANNPSLFAITDALQSWNRKPEEIRLLSVGVGHYPEPKRPFWYRLLQMIPSAHLLQKTLNTNANTTELLVDLLFESMPHVRVSDRFEAPELATDFLESRQAKLNLLTLKGRDSYQRHEASVKSLFQL